MTYIKDADNHVTFAVDETAKVIEHRVRRNGWEYITRFWWNPDGTYAKEATKEPVKK
ncbi:MAG: hypothetical protein FWD39_03595 [Clostridiales bacterium]|nr:hypothetical protein [Clostridiales bacterium]